MSIAATAAIDMNKLNAFIGQFVTDLGALVHAGMVVIGEKLGLYKALATASLSSEELAAITRLRRKHFRGRAMTSWLSSIACTTWAIRSEPRRTSGNHLLKMASG